MRTTKTHKIKLMGFAVMSVLLPVLAILAVMAFWAGDLRDQVRTEKEALAKANLERSAGDLYQMCEVSHDILRRKIDRDLGVARQFIAGKGPLRTLERQTLRWIVRNPITQEESPVLLPRLLAGTIRFEQNDDPHRETVLVDEVARLTGGTCSIFQRMNKQGDMLCVATTMVQDNGKRAIGGTYVPAMNPGGLPNPLVASILSGKVHRYYDEMDQAGLMKACDPLRSNTREVIGMICVGEKPDAAALIQKNLAGVRVGPRGEAAVIETGGKSPGRLIFSRDGTAGAPDLWSRQDVSGRLYIQDMMRQSLIAVSGEVLYEPFTVRPPGKDEPETRIAAFLSFRPFDWFLFVSEPAEDVISLADQAGESLRPLVWVIILVTTSFLVMALLAAAFLGRETTKLMRLLTDMASNIAAGDIRKARRELADEFNRRRKKTGNRKVKDETAELLNAFGFMTDRLAAAKSQLPPVKAEEKPPHREDTVSRTPLAPETGILASDEPSKSGDDKAGSLLRESVSAEIVDARTTIEEAIGAMQFSIAALKEESDGLQTFSLASSRLTSRFGGMKVQAARLSEQATAFGTLADRTTLLALNAAIAAEKAGEHAKGLVGIASEAGRLSRETELVANDIDGAAGKLQSMTEEGLMESEQASLEAKKIGTKVTAIREKIGGAADHLRACEHRLTGVSEMIHGKTGDSGRAGTGVNLISAFSVQLETSLSQVVSALDGVTEAMEGVQDKLSETGLPVVAREVKQMTDQTLTAARNLDAAVATWQASSAAPGTVQLNPSKDALQENIDKVKQTGERLSLIMDHLQTYGMQTDGLKEDLDGNADKAKQMKEVMMRLQSTSALAKQSLQSFCSAMEGLQDTLNAEGQKPGPRHD